MSAKWVRSKRWEREHLTGPFAPVRWVLHAFSTITMAVVLLVLLSLYGVLASVPIGMLALAPTWGVYALLFGAVVGCVAGLPVWIVWRQMGAMKVGFAGRFTVAVFLSIALTACAWVLWIRVVWPVVHYDPLTGEGLRFFGSFVDRYRTETVRRLPGMEMSELEFYSWWPLNVLLYLFVINMVTATVRRIEFTFANIGVLTVHTGIITLALGSAYYAMLKQEGDTLLTAGPIDPATGRPAMGKPEAGFFDNTRTVLRVRQTRTTAEKLRLRLPPGVDWAQLPLRNVPRYNEYGLAVLPSNLTPAGAALGDGGRVLDELVEAEPLPLDHAPLIDRDVRFRVVGYAPYAELTESWQEAVASDGSALVNNPVRFVSLLSGVGDGSANDHDHDGDGKPDHAPGDHPGDASAAGELRPVQVFGLAPRVPAERLGVIGGAIAVESFANLPDARWEELKAPLPDGARHGLIVEVPAGAGGPAAARVYAMAVGKTIELNGYRLTVQSLSAEPPLPIITPGYRGATSSVAVVRVEAPAADGRPAETFDRYVYSRLPELNQDLVVGAGADAQTGQPKRRAADGRINLVYVDATMVQVYIDERGVPPADQPANAAAVQGATVRAIVRVPGRGAVVREGLKEGDRLEIGPLAAVELGRLISSARRVGVPRVVPIKERDRENTGNHRRALLGVEVMVMDTDGQGEADLSKPAKWRQVVWLPFRQYYDLEPQEGASVRLPDGREVEVVFGRLWRAFGGIELQLADFEMIPYPHSTQPRDFRSDLLVRKYDGRLDRWSEHTSSTSLNDPLLASAFVWSPERSWFKNAALRVAAELGPWQYKLSQSGWDPTGWNQTKAQAEAGTLPRASARFTILGVGNNPGISIIALGGVLMGLGIPWAFYVKPWLVRRKRDRIMAELAAAGKLPAKRRDGTNSTTNGAGPKTRGGTEAKA